MKCPSWLTAARASNEWQAPTCQIAATFRTKLPQAVGSVEYLCHNSTPSYPGSSGIATELPSSNRLANWKYEKFSLQCVLTKIF